MHEMHRRGRSWERAAEDGGQLVDSPVASRPAHRHGTPPTPTVGAAHCDFLVPCHRPEVSPRLAHVFVIRQLSLNNEKNSVGWELAWCLPCRELAIVDRLMVDGVYLPFCLKGGGLCSEALFELARIRLCRA